MIKAPTLDLGGICHGFLTREGVVSTGIYASLNCGPGSDDVPVNVTENRRRAVDMVGLGQVPLVTCSQIHSADVVRVRAPWDQSGAPKADALVTDQPGLALGVLTADCAPVLFADAASGVVGAAHAGWKGAVGGVIEATLAAMVELGAKPNAIHAAVGPCISQASYEVGADLRDVVLGASAWAEDSFVVSPETPGHFHFDLPGYVAGRLARLHLDRVEILGFDTYSQPEHFFSYRRTTHDGGGDYGRALSVIGLAG